MLDTVTSVSLLTLMEVVGPLLLLAALIYGTTQYRKRSRETEQYTDEATRKLYREQTHDHR
jgi:hypothetical protein